MNHDSIKLRIDHHLLFQANKIVSGARIHDLGKAINAYQNLVPEAIQHPEDTALQDMAVAAEKRLREAVQKAQEELVARALKAKTPSV